MHGRLCGETIFTEDMSKIFFFCFRLRRAAGDIHAVRRAVKVRWEGKKFLLRVEMKASFLTLFNNLAVFVIGLRHCDGISGGFPHGPVAVNTYGDQAE